jgi:tetratricopeptide (TPR) repeat protein
MRIGRGKQWVATVLLSMVLVTIGRAGVVAYWGFDDPDPSVVTEERGGKDGIRVGNLRQVEGRIGAALRFYGDHGHVRIRHDPVFNIRSRITIAAWIKADRLENAFATVIAKGDSAWRIARDVDRDVLQFAANSGNTLWVVRGSKNVNDGTWHHVAGVFDGTKACLYVDGELDASLATTRPFNANGFDVCIGENAEIPGRYWQGFIDDVLILDHALSAEQVKELCAKGAKALVSEELGTLCGAISGAQKALAARDARRALLFLRWKLAQSERELAEHPSRVGPAGRMIMSELYYLLAEAQAAASAPRADIIRSYRKAATTSLWSRRYVPALLQLHRYVAPGEYAKIVGESVRSCEDLSRRVSFVVAPAEADANWAAFEQFLDTAFPHVADPVAFAERIGRGLTGRAAWAEAFDRYCRDRPSLKPYHVATRMRLAQDALVRRDFMAAADIYRSIRSECDRERDATACETGICECLFHEGRYRQVIARVDRLVAERGATGLSETRRAQLLKGRAHLQLDELDEAEATFASLAGADPGADVAPEATFLRGYCNLRQKDWEEATRRFTAVVEQYPESSFVAKARLGLGRVKQMRQ